MTTARLEPLAEAGVGRVSEPPFSGIPAIVQDSADLAAIARRAGEEGQTPFLVVQDGSGAFLQVAPFARRRGLSARQLFAALRPALMRVFGKGGVAVVDANLALIREAYSSLIDMTAAVAARRGTVVRPELEEVLA